MAKRSKHQRKKEARRRKSVGIKPTYVRVILSDTPSDWKRPKQTGGIIGRASTIDELYQFAVSERVASQRALEARKAAWAANNL